MSKIIESIEQRQLRPNIPQFKAGDTVRVHFQVIEGQRRRVQVFEGIVIKRQGAGARETFTVRKQSFGIGVERTFPLHSPKIEKIEVHGDRRRATARSSTTCAARSARRPASARSSTCGREEGARPPPAPRPQSAEPEPEAVEPEAGRRGRVAPEAEPVTVPEAPADDERKARRARGASRCSQPGARTRGSGGREHAVERHLREQGATGYELDRTHCTRVARMVAQHLETRVFLCTVPTDGDDVRRVPRHGSARPAASAIAPARRGIDCVQPLH